MPATTICRRHQLRLFLPHGCAAPLQGEIYEYLDYFICDFVDRMDWRLDRFSCRRRPHPLITGFWSDISNTSFRVGKKSCIGIACTTLTFSSLSETLGTTRKIFPPRAEPAGIRAKKSASASPKLEWRGNMELLRKTMPPEFLAVHMEARKTRSHHGR